MSGRIDWFNDPECVKLIDFLVEKTKNVKKAMNVNGLIREFKIRSRSKLGENCWIGRIKIFRLGIHEMSRLNNETKVKLMFGLSAPVDHEFLEELREVAKVIVDNSNRIIHYKKNGGGGLELKHHRFGERRDDGEIEEKHGDSSDDSEKEDMKVTTRSRKLSKKRSSLFNDKDDMFAPPQNKILKSSNKSTTSDKKRKILDYMTGTDKKKNRVVETPPQDRNDDNDYSFDVSSYQHNDENRVKLEPFDGPLKMDLSRGAVINDGENFVEEIPAPTENFVAPNYKEMLMDVKLEEPEVIILNDQKEIKKEAAENAMETFDDSVTLKHPVQQDSEDVEKNHTPLTTILESFHDFINILDLSILSDLQKKIEEKLEECKNNDTKKVSNTGIYCSLELCLLSVNKNWEINESMESFRLDHFMIPFRHAVITLKLPSLADFQEKLKGIIRELRVQNKLVPATAIRSALQSVIDNVINS